LPNPLKVGALGNDNVIALKCHQLGALHSERKWKKKEVKMTFRGKKTQSYKNSQSSSVNISGSVVNFSLPLLEWHEKCKVRRTKKKSGENRNLLSRVIADKETQIILGHLSWEPQWIQ
jgi:hypothetical protein